MSDRIVFTAKPKIKENLEQASDKTGLTQSEIARRGLIEQLQKLPTEDQK